VKILVANRGEIALRIIRSCREMGVRSVAVYSDADANALYVRAADEAVRIGEAEASQSYLNIPAVLQAALDSRVDAIHPGYGFLSENPEFAQAVEAAGMQFIGPTAEVIALTGDKLAARRVAKEAGLPVLAGYEEALDGQLPADLANHIRFPVLIKAVAGGGGRGIRLASGPAEFEQMYAAARKEAMAAFGNDMVYLEQLVQSARHIEVQVMGDGKGGYLCFGERECSIQRRRQKLIEEAPAPGLSEGQRNRLYEDALKLARALNYRGLGTVEFLMDEHGDYYFIEINPRIQVEHPVTELVTRTDLVGAQLTLAMDGRLCYTQERVTLQGWAIEARVLAEDPENGFLPATGEIEYLKEPGGPGVRVDSALYPGMSVSSYYDSLLAKVIAWGEDRAHALRRMSRALDEFRIGGIPTDLEFLKQVVISDGFVGGQTNTSYLDHFEQIYVRPDQSIEEEVALAAALMAHNTVEPKPAVGTCTPENTWQQMAWREQMNGKL
jgi:acetyl-CoA carboxylase biotin carboxylase subunit